MKRERNIGELFQQETKYHRSSMQPGFLDWSNKPALYKEYPGAHQVKLPESHGLGDVTLHEVLLRRKSLRRFVDTSITQENLSCLLWACAGIQRKEMGFEFRTVPSAGALYPIETYLVAHKVESLDAGVYHYNVKHHLLEEIRRGDFRSEIAKAGLGQLMCAHASAVIIWTALFERAQWKYRQRAYRYVYLDAGHVAQNLGLAATSLGLGCCHIGALFDDELNQIIGVDGVRESVLYMSVVGHTGVFV